MSLRQRGFFYFEKGVAVDRPEHPQKPGRLGDPNHWLKMILFVCAKLNEISDQGRKFNWIKPDRCPRCDSVKLWGHGFVSAYFDGFAQGVFLRRFRCPDCRCIIRMKPQGCFRRFQASVHTIRSCIAQRLSDGKWRGDLSRSRQRHWLSALKRKTMAFFGAGKELIAGFDQLMQMGAIPVSRAI